uniref:Ig-like domain-containing protein n=1 Tax=Astyanax mexicanus TaxID=7994 RepID=A0A8B9GU15_ASTMX
LIICGVCRLYVVCVCVCVFFLKVLLVLFTEKFRLVVPEAPVFSVSGSDVVLSCSVRELDRPNIMVNAVNMNVTWFRSDLRDSLVHLYGNHKDLNTDQNPSYRGRTAVFNEELKNGDVSLKLSNVRISDEGEYTCRVDSRSWWSDKTFKLSVEGKHFTINVIPSTASLTSQVQNVPLHTTMLQRVLLAGAVL